MYSELHLSIHWRLESVLHDKSYACTSACRRFEWLIREYEHLYVFNKLNTNLMEPWTGQEIPGTSVDSYSFFGQPEACSWAPLRGRATYAASDDSSDDCQQLGVVARASQTNAKCQASLNTPNMLHLLLIWAQDHLPGH